MKRTIIISEEQLKILVSRLDEMIAGYDDYHTMFQHAGKSMSELMDQLQQLMIAFNNLSEFMYEENYLGDDFVEAIKDALTQIYEFNDISEMIFKDFSEKEVVKNGEILLRKLESFQEKAMMFIEMYKHDSIDLKKLVSLIAIKIDDIVEFVRNYRNAIVDSDTKFQNLYQKKMK
jgi:hypothetical protein